MSTQVNTVSLTLPTGWREFDPRSEDLLAELERNVDVPAGARDVAVSLLAPLALELRRATAASDVVLVGFFAQAIDIEGAPDPLVLTANVTLAVSPEVGGLAEVRAVLEGDGATVAPVDLPAGAGVVSTGETLVSGDTWDGTVTARTRRYLVPVPGTSRMAALNFLTPNLDLADQFDEVFDAIAGSLSFSWDEPDQPADTSGT